MIYLPIEAALFVFEGEVIKHPIFGRVLVDHIFRAERPGEFEAFTILEDFNNSHKIFDLKELSNLKFSNKSLKVLK